MTDKRRRGPISAYALERISSGRYRPPDEKDVQNLLFGLELSDVASATNVLESELLDFLRGTGTPTYGQWRRLLKHCNPELHGIAYRHKDWMP